MPVVVHGGEIQTVVRILEHRRLARAALELAGNTARRVFKRERGAIEFRRIVDQRITVIQGADRGVRAGAGPAGRLIHAQPRSQDTAEILCAADIGFRHRVDHRDDLPAGVDRAKRARRADRSELIEDRGRTRRVGQSKLAVRGVERALQLEVDLVAAADIFASLQAPVAGIDAAILELIDVPQVWRVRLERRRRGALIQQSGVDYAVERNRRLGMGGGGEHGQCRSTAQL
ncbi:hypothetical protein AWB81_08572 [Caballeronia arationis]|nr:hypothetical protein AWB81_08572 [Caballeronia arationis]